MDVLLSACLVVRDEAARIDRCLQALAGLVDEVVVHDTGSLDGTPARLAAHGAVVVAGGWEDDFAAARNVALERARGRWVLSVDADEVVRADAAALRRWLADVPEDQLAVTIRNPVVGGGAGYASTTVKLFRRAGARWAGRVHERVVSRGVEDDETPLRLVPPHLLHIEHDGYADLDTQHRKSARNARLAALQLDDLAACAQPDPREVARAALDLGRSCIGAGELQRAVDALELARAAAASGALWRQATDHLARLLLGAGEAEVALVLADQLEGGGAPPEYCRWLRAQGLAQTGRPADAIAQLQHVGAIVDTAGRSHDPAALGRLRALCEELLAA
ncbi:glycosyltransferase family 2 protein [Kineococcus sp. SYSU DK006]|uniref:glycosyltransferase family 2 protein n=1 Tax=Kineococcus sp. SYSU DK006 TaxID=3383127 RepID=UPI003D7DF6B6